MTDWNAVLGCDPAEYCSRVYASRPAWITGYIAFEDAQFLFARVLTSGADPLLEIGTASGLSTAILCHAAHAVRLAGEVGDAFTIESYDIDERFYADRSRRVGDAAREMLEPALLEHVTFRSPATAADVSAHHGPETLAFAFIDAAHTHPWPTLDLLTLLPTLSPGAEVVLHDINLPIARPETQHWGAKHLFDGLDVERKLGRGDPPNIGSIRVPQDKSAFREQLLAILHGYEWETEIDEDVIQLAVS